MSVKQIWTAIYCTLAALLIASIVAVVFAPPGTRAPLHFDAAGNPDAWTGRFGFLLIPLLTWLFMSIMHVVQRQAGVPGTHAVQMTQAGVGLIVVMAMSSVQTMLVARALGWRAGETSMMSRMVGVLVGGLLVIVARSLAGVPQNHAYGIRTAWTRTNAESWRRTNDAGGKLLAALGLATMITAVIWPRWYVAVLSGGTVSLVLWALLYSRSVAHKSRADDDASR